MTSNHKIYNKVALIYDELMKEVNYKLWAEYIKDVIKKFSKSSGPVLELAAGTCKLSSTLRSDFSKIVASDISFSMLKNSEDKQLLKICCDMTCLPVKNKFPVIFSAFDSVNYLLTRKQLMKLFNEVKSILTDDGVFTFDVSLYKNSIDHIRDYQNSGEFNGISFSRVSRFNKLNRLHKNVFDISDQTKKITREIHVQKIYEFHTYFDLIYDAGLKVVECYEAFTFNAGNSGSARVQFITMKQR